MASRRNFIQQTALGIAGSVALPLLGKAAPALGSAADQTNNNAAKSAIPLGIAGYTFLNSIWINLLLP